MPKAIPIAIVAAETGDAIPAVLSARCEPQALPPRFRRADRFAGGRHTDRPAGAKPRVGGGT